MAIYVDGIDKKNPPILELLVSFDKNSLHGSTHNIRIISGSEAATEAERRCIGEGGRNCRREDECESDTGGDHDLIWRQLTSRRELGFYVNVVVY